MPQSQPVTPPAQAGTSKIIICGSSKPRVGSRVPMRSQLHDNGFGSCHVVVIGLYGEQKEEIFCSFTAFPSPFWKPGEYSPHSLSWLERRIKTWDAVWPDAQWRVELQWPWQSETWCRTKPGQWRVTAVGDGFV